MKQGTYLAHISPDGRKQTVADHLKGTAARCAAFASSFGAAEQGTLAGIAHDIGKFSAGFQKRLHGGPRVDHASAGALECALLGQSSAAFSVIGHHSGLPDLGVRDDQNTSTFCGRINKAAGGGIEDYSSWKEEVSLPVASFPSFCGSDAKTDAFFTRMLYSCLVDADFLDTEEFMNGGPVPRGSMNDMDELNRRLDSYVSGWFPPKGDLNEERCQILSCCLEQGSMQNPGLFSLTVPTGGGKTVASLAFALRHAQKHHMDHVIYVIPYTSIIEQTADTFRRILGPENVLEHHSGVPFDVGTELSKENIALAKATENWDIPVIVTTAVQFFESLYANRSSACRKLHNMANSVIIFDEAQMLPIPYLNPCIFAISQLVDHYGSSAVLCTATQPALEGRFREYLPDHSCTELCPPALTASPVFRRVTFQKAGKLSWEDLANQLKQQQQVLCIVNSRASAYTLFSLLQDSDCFHLSTLMIPAHRRQTIREIRDRLKAGLPCRVISTSLIEAGVDVDFPAVFREEAGLDSILQAAGRCNREGRRSADDSIVTVFTAPDKPPALFSTAIVCGRMAMEQYDDLSGQEAVHFYFRELLDLRGGDALDKNHILQQLGNGLFPFRTVAEQFHLIENDTRTICIPTEEGADLIGRRRQGEVSRELLRALNQYSVSVYDRHFQALYDAGDIEALDENTFVLTNLSLYSRETGLSLEADSGKAEFI